MSNNQKDCKDNNKRSFKVAKHIPQWQIDLAEKLLLDNVSFEQDNEGQLMIYTDVYVDNEND